MKKSLFIALFTVIAAIASAQQSNVQSAARSMTFNPLKYNDIVRAKESIDLAAANEAEQAAVPNHDGR